jgi:hypothetical protein
MRYHCDMTGNFAFLHAHLIILLKKLSFQIECNSKEQNNNNCSFVRPNSKQSVEMFIRVNNR